jgi:hypothetical protein
MYLCTCRSERLTISRSASVAESAFNHCSMTDGASRFIQCPLAPAAPLRLARSGIAPSEEDALFCAAPALRWQECNQWRNGACGYWARPASETAHAHVPERLSRCLGRLFVLVRSNFGIMYDNILNARQASLVLILSTSRLTRQVSKVST